MFENDEGLKFAGIRRMSQCIYRITVNYTERRNIIRSAGIM